MKAIELVKALVYDSALAEYGGLCEWTGACTLRDYFGAVSHRGEMTKGTYFYFYPDSTDTLVVCPTYDPDVIVETEDAGDVWLWKLED